jgi:hypothetical protein
LENNDAAIIGGTRNVILSGTTVTGSDHTRSVIAGGTQITSVSSDMLHASRLFLSAGGLPTSDPGVAGVVYLSAGASGTFLAIST